MSEDPRFSPASPPAAPAVEFQRVSLAFDDREVLRDLSFTVPTGAMSILLGASGCGKSVILKLIVGLLRPDAGTVVVNGQRIDTMSERDLLRVRTDIGIVFQENALFDSLTVDENVGYRLYEESRMPDDEVRARVAIARAMAPRPGLILYDDPTTGLDPLIAATVDDEIVKLRDLEQVTSLVVTHQIRDAHYIATHHAFRAGDRVEIARTPDGQSRAEFLVLNQGRISPIPPSSPPSACHDR